MGSPRILTLTRGEAMALTLLGIPGVGTRVATFSFGQRDVSSSDPQQPLRLSSRAGLFHAVDWLGAGEKCPESANPAACAEGPATLACRKCGGSGWLRRPCDLLWTLRHDVDPAVAVVAVWASVMRVGAGLPAIRFVRDPWVRSQMNPVHYRTHDGAVCMISDTPEEQAENDARALSEGDMLINGSGDDLTLTVEVP